MKSKEQDIDEVPLSFGKHQGKTPTEVAEEDPSYLIWLHDNVNASICSRSLYLACEEDRQQAQAQEDIENEHYDRRW